MIASILYVSPGEIVRNADSCILLLESLSQKVCSGTRRSVFLAITPDYFDTEEAFITRRNMILRGNSIQMSGKQRARNVFK